MEEDKRILAAGEVDAEVELEGAADGTFGETCGEGAVFRFELGSAVGEQRLDLGYRQCSEPVEDGAGADGGQKLLRVLGEQDEREVFGRLFEDLEKAVGGLLHEGRGGEDGEGARGLDGRSVVGGVDDLADLAELDEQLRRVGRNDEHVGVGLDEDASVALVGLAKVFAGGDGLGYALLEVGSAGDAEAVAAAAAEVGQVVGLGGVEAVDGLG